MTKTTDDAPYGYTKRGTPRKRAPRGGEGRKDRTDTSEKVRKGVRAAAGYGLDERKISRVVGITRKTLTKHFKEELEQGRDQADAKVVESLYQNCLNGVAVSQIFWCCNRMPDQWRHVSHIQHSGTIEHEHNHHTALDEFFGRIAGISARQRDSEGAQKTNGSAGPPALN